MDDAFLDAITADPDDLIPRLVYADWLEEQDDPARAARAEFIRVQHTLATTKPAPAELARLAVRQKELLDVWRGVWEELFATLVCSCEYRVGFAERVTLGVEHFIVGFAELVHYTPVVRLRLHRLTVETAAEVAASPALAHVRELDLQHEFLPPQVLAVLLRSPHLTRLRSLNLARNPLFDPGVRELIAANVLGRLRYLNLAEVGMTAVGLGELLAELTQLPNLQLQHLVLRGPARLPGHAVSTLVHHWPWRLRQSVLSQVAQDTPQWQSWLGVLQPMAGDLVEELRRWVTWFTQHEVRKLPDAVKLVPLPAAVQRAFAQACGRRVVWRAARSRQPLPVIPVDAEGDPKDLSGLVRLLQTLAPEEEAEAVALRECLLDLFLRHVRDELPPDGRTRAGR